METIDTNISTGDNIVFLEQKVLRMVIRQLTLNDVDEVFEDEILSFPPYLRASRETILQRLRDGHVMLGVRVNSRLVGKICFRYAVFSPDDPGTFPQAFHAFSSGQTGVGYNTAYVYNLNLQPKYRSFRALLSLARSAIERARNDGCKHMVCDGRIATYKGSRLEGIEQQLELHKAIDRCLSGGPFPTDEEFCLDPLLAFYRRLGGRFLWLFPDFLPEDAPSGGMRVIVYRPLDTTKPV